jgi:hypothetical protein
MRFSAVVALARERVKVVHDGLELARVPVGHNAKIAKRCSNRCPHERTSSGTGCKFLRQGRGLGQADCKHGIHTADRRTAAAALETRPVSVERTAFVVSPR